MRNCGLTWVVGCGTSTSVPKATLALTSGSFSLHTGNRFEIIFGKPQHHGFTHLFLRNPFFNCCAFSYLPQFVVTIPLFYIILSSAPLRTFSLPPFWLPLLVSCLFFYFEMQSSTISGILYSTSFKHAVKFMPYPRCFDSHGIKIGSMAEVPKYKRIIQYNAQRTNNVMAGMGTHIDNHHIVGAVSCVLQVGQQDSKKGLYTCPNLGNRQRLYCEETEGASFCVPKGVCHGVRKSIRSKNRVVLAVGW